MADPIQFANQGFTIQFRNEELPLIRKPDDSSFSDLLRQAINDASSLESEAQNRINAFVNGEPIEIHEVMAAVQEAGISLTLLIEVRNKLTEAYRTVMNLS